MDLRISKLRHHKVAFPRQNEIYALAYRINTCLDSHNMTTYTLREALALANSGHRILHDDVVQDIEHLWA